MFRLSLETDNAAFEDGPVFMSEEVARLLELAAQNVRAGAYAGKLIDINGNTVGEWELER